MQRTSKSGPHDHTDTHTDSRPVPRRKPTRTEAHLRTEAHREARTEPHRDVRTEERSVSRTPSVSRSVAAGLDSAGLDPRERSRRIAERARARVEVEGYASPAARKAAASAPRVSRRVRAAEQSDETTDSLQRPFAGRKLRNPLQGAGLRTIAAASFAVLVSMTLLVMIIIAQKDYTNWQAQVEFREAQLASLEEQHDVGKRRLAALASPKGRDQLLVEHGYLNPGDRILLFPATPAEKQAADIPKNDLSPHPPISQDSGSDPNASVWKRAGDAFRAWWNSGR